MLKSKTRYGVEHHLLRIWFFEETRRVIEYLKQDEQFVGKVTQSIAKEEKENLYVDLSQYKCQIVTVKDQYYCAMLLFPSPTQVPECYMVYLFFDNDFRPYKFYTVEKGAEHTFLCEWTAQQHLNHGEVETDPQAVLAKVLEMFEHSLEIKKG